MELPLDWYRECECCCTKRLSTSNSRSQKITVTKITVTKITVTKITVTKITVPKITCQHQTHFATGLAIAHALVIIVQLSTLVLLSENGGSNYDSLRE